MQPLEDENLELVTLLKRYNLMNSKVKLIYSFDGWEES